MGRISRLSDQALNRLLAGKTSADDGELEELAAFMRDVRLLEEPPAAETATKHLAAIVEAARAEAQAERVRPAQRRFRRNLMPSAFSNMRTRLVFVTAGAALLLLATFGGAAYAGALPGPVQSAVAGAAGNVGISLPGEDENNVDQGDVNNVDEGNANNVDEGNVNNVDEGQQNNVDEGAVSNVDEGQQNNADEGHQNNVDEGDQNDNVEQQGNVQQGDQGNADQGDADQGTQDSGDQGSQDSGDQGSQGNGDNSPAQGGGDQGGQGNGNN